MKYYFIYFIACIKLKFNTGMTNKQIKEVAKQIAYFRTYE